VGSGNNFNDFPRIGDGTSLPGGGTTIVDGGTMVERQFQVVERQTQVVERRSGPFRLNLTTALSTRCPPPSFRFLVPPMSVKLYRVLSSI